MIYVQVAEALSQSEYAQQPPRSTWRFCNAPRKKHWISMALTWMLTFPWF